ncbi:MAG TPA: DUF3618 domain-containing protein [Pyrinomonadaceae bacterium]|nr:DUF3618 domain-containing protein [Pyrinomonadaceae bacterium]
MSRKAPPAAAPDEPAREPTKDELRRQMEETRENISETVAEIKDVVTQQYEEVRERVETVKEGVEEVVNWGEHFEKNPLVWGAGAVSVGILIGLGLARVFDDEDEIRRGRKGYRKGTTGELLTGELTGLADAVLPTISTKIKEMFGLDLTAYLKESRRLPEGEVAVVAVARPRRAPAKKKPAARKAGAKKKAAKSSKKKK